MALHVHSPGHPTGNFKKKDLKTTTMHEWSFLIKHFGRLLGKKYRLLTPSKTEGRVPSQQGVPTTHNLQPGILGGLTGCGRSKVQFTRSVEGAERSDARNGGSTKIAENSRNWALTKIAFHLLKIWFKFLSLDKFIPFPFLSNVYHDGQWNSHFLPKNSNERKWTTFLTFRLFLGIFQWNYLQTSSVH